MKVLIDSHVVLWSAFLPTRLSTKAASTISGAEQVFVSAITPYELEWRARSGRMSFPTITDWEAALRRAGWEFLPVQAAHGIAAAALPVHHRDPWDRLIVAQAKMEGADLVTNDRELARYEVNVIW